MEAEHTSLSVEQALSIVRRRAPWTALCLLVFATGAYGLSARQAKQYTATASLVFNNNQQAQQVAGLQAVAVSNPQSQQQTDLKLVQKGDMAERTAAKLGGGLSGDRVREEVKVSAEGESNIVDVAATAHSPTLAAAIANTYADQFVSEQQNSNHSYYASALALVNKQLAALSPKQRLSPSGLALAGRAQSLGVLAELKNGNVQVVQNASVPTHPSAPRTLRNTLLGGALGLLLGLALAFLLERLDRRIRTPQDLQEIYGLPLLGVVPESRALSAGRSPAGASASLAAGDAEAFHLLRAHLRYFNVDRELRSLLVASAAPGDGKSTVARHLAAAAARMGSRVLLIEVDLRRPTLARQLELRAGPGLSDVLVGAASLGEATQSIAVEQPSPQRAQPKGLDVLVAGAMLPPNPGELLESRAMESLLASAKSLYELIVVDTPPMTAVSDAFPLLHRVDGVIVVGRVGRNRRDVARRLQETLTGAGAPLLGVVANGLKGGDGGAYGYAYEYGERTAASAPADASAEGASAGDGSAGDAPAGAPASNGSAAHGTVANVNG
jgi:receptor protein-tyrosine kinase